MASSVRKREDRLVAYCRSRRLYLGFDCVGSTESRVWAWSGTLRQARNMVQLYPAAEDFQIYWDGEERDGRPVDVA